MQKICEECGSNFKTFNENKKYCNTKCTQAAYKKKMGYNTSTRASATTGAMSELVAATDLMRQGYHVFRALSPACPCDLVILNKEGEVRNIEVRTGGINKSSGKLMFVRNGEKRGEDMLDHYAVVVYDADGNGKVTYDPPLP